MESLSHKEFEVYKSDRLVESLKKLPSFIDNIKDKSIFYPWCFADISPLIAFPDNNITFLDKDAVWLNAIRKYISDNKPISSHNKGILENKMDSNFNQQFDILIDQRSQIPVKNLDKAIKSGWYVIVENAHGNCNYFNSNSWYEFVENLSTGSKTYKPVERAIEWLTTGDSNYYLFKKLNEGEVKKEEKKKLPNILQRTKNYFIKLFSS